MSDVPEPARGHDVGPSATERALRERVKELSCLYGISLEAAKERVPLADRLQAIVRHLPPAWQHPDAAAARLRLDDIEIATAGWGPAGPRQETTIVIDGVPRGVVEVAYCVGAESRSLAFLPEERDLIDAVARKVALLVERIEAEQERERLRDQLRHADRLATIGRMAAGLGHEINEPLGSILGFAQLLQKDQGLSSDAAADVDKIVKAALRAREIVRRLLLFARPTPPHRERLDLVRLASEIVEDYRGRASRQEVEIDLSMPSMPVELVADGSQLTQVLVNLVVNALHAMPKGGTLTVRVAEEADEVSLAVRDSGEGMDADVRQHVFEPFFTTRDVGEGTGLGLSVAHGIVQAHGGRFEVASVPGRGSTFTVRLPKCTRAADGEAR